MVGLPTKRRAGPIGVDIGSRAVKLLQFNAECTDVIESARWDLPSGAGSEPGERTTHVVEAIRRAREGRGFRGKKAVFCLSSADLFVQNIRVPQASGDELRKIVSNEAATRLPFASEESELRFLEAANVRQGDAIRREVIVLACHRPVLGRVIETAERAGLLPVAIDVEPAALIRCYCKQFRRDEDQQQCMMFINLGTSNTMVVIARGNDAMFVKYLDIGGRHMDQAVARHLKMKLADASALRRHNGDRRADQRDPEITRSIGKALRPVLDQLAGELSMCIRYYSVTFRGHPLSRIVLSGGEASGALADWLGTRLDVACEVGNPLRSYTSGAIPGRGTQWDVAAGLALRDMKK